MHRFNPKAAIVAYALSASLMIPVPQAGAMTAVNTAPAFSGVETATLPIVKVQRRGSGQRWYRGGGGGGARAFRGGGGARAFRGGGGGARAFRGGGGGARVARGGGRQRVANQGWRGNRAYRGGRYANRGWRKGWRGSRYAYRNGGWGWGYPYYYDNGYYNGYFAAGVIGLATGAIIGSALSQPYYYDAPVSYAYAPWTPEWYSYCAAKYRSFNPDTGYYLAYSGRYRFCR